MHKIDVDQGSFEWHQLRHGNVTGTSLKSAIGSPAVQKTLLNKIVSERMTEVQINDASSSAMDRGNELEPVARRAVIKKTGLKFIETGLLVSENVDGFKISPDGIFEKDGKIIGGLEIKCPGSGKHVEYLIQGGVPKEYMTQVAAPFIMSDDIQWWYFASFDDRNYERPLFIYKVEASSIPDIQQSREKLSEFLSRVETQHSALTF